MSGRAKWLWALFGLVVIGVSVFMVRTFSAAGQFTSLPDYGTKACMPIHNIPGPEDIALDRSTGTALVSSLDRRSGSLARGNIFSIELSGKISKDDITALSGDRPADFSPLGVSLFVTDGGERRLFVINRPPNVAPSVELFVVEESKLTHVKSFKHGEFATANNLVAVGPNAFYLTNDGVEDIGFIQAFFDFANQKKKGNVIYFDGQKPVVVARGFVMPNGIAKSVDGKRIYVSDTLARTLFFFARETGNSLKKIGDIFVGTGLDNIDVDEKDHIWIAAHPKIFDFVTHKGSAKNNSPSQIIEAAPGVKEGGKMRTVFLDKGDRLSGSSIGVAYQGRVLIGSVYGKKLLLCDIPAWEKPEKK